MAEERVQRRLAAILAADAVGYTRLAHKDEIPADRGLRIKHDGKYIALFNVKDEIFAINALCPHAGAFLDMGYMDDYSVICPLHGWDFDVRTGESPTYGIATNCFDIEVIDDVVYLKPAD